MPASFSSRSLLLKSIAIEAPWYAFLLTVERFPIPQPEREPVRDWVDKLTQRLCAGDKLSPEVFLQFNHVHHEEGARRLSSCGRQWMPQLGLGIWPDGEPPTLWTMEEFQDLAPGEMIRPLMDQVFRVSTGVPSRHEARNAMFGRGACLQFLMPSNNNQLIERGTQLLLPRIAEPSFRAFEYYVPLLEAKSLEQAAPETLDEWLCGAQTYLRESVEDSGILILTSAQLPHILREMRALASPGGAEWLLAL